MAKPKPDDDDEDLEEQVGRELKKAASFIRITPDGMDKIKAKLDERAKGKGGRR